MEQLPAGRNPGIMAEDLSIKLTPMKKQFLIVSVSVVLAAGLALSGFGCQVPTPSVNNEIGISVTTVTSTPIPTPTANATPTATPVVTATPEFAGTGYTNQTYGYNFLYSPAWHLSQSNTDEATAVVNFTEGSGRELAGSEAKIEIIVIPNTGGQTLNNFVEAQLDYANTTINRRELELVGGEKAYWVQMDGSLGTVQTYYVEHGANFFLITLYAPTLSSQNQQDYDALVSSFQFVR